LSFLHLQISLMDEYRLRLCQINRELSNSLDKIKLGVLNSINYMIYILNEWKNSKFFIKMQFIQIRYKQFEENQERNESMNEDELSESKITLTEEQIKKFDLQVNVN
jgi:hypothetical protein